MNNGRYPILGYNASGKPIVDTDAGYSVENEFVKTDWEYPAKGWSTSDNYWIKAPNMYKDREPRFYITVFLVVIIGCMVKPERPFLLLKVVMETSRLIIRRADIYVIVL